MSAIGQPLVREGAIAKVTGAARYAADVPVDGALHAVLVTSGVARGRIRSIDDRAARSLPGVHLVLTHENLAGELAEDCFLGRGGHFQSSVNPLGSAEILHFGQIVALIVAESVGIAEQAAGGITLRYDRLPANASLQVGLAGAELVAPLSIDVGDTAATMREAAATIDAVYTTPVQHQNPIEPYSTTARWSGEHLEVHVPSQWVAGTCRGLAKVLGVPRDRVRVLSRVVGGAFGAKASVFWHSALVAVAARRLRRPVKLVVSRTQMFTVGSFRPESRQQVRLAALADGRLLAYGHRSWGQTSRMDRLVLPGTDYSARIYAAPAIATREYAVPTDVNTPGFMRAPLEVPSAFALESAMDELAVALDLDPVRLRLLNEPQRDPVGGLPFSSRGLAQCLERGAEIFGWSDRDRRIGAMRDTAGRRLGWGCAAAWYPVYRAPAAARVRLFPDGRAQVAVAAHELGQGVTNILAQIAAARLGLPADRVTVEVGDSDLPVGPMAGGSSTTASAGSAIDAACRRLLDQRRDGTVATASDGAVEVTLAWCPEGLSDAAMQDAMTGGRVKTGPFSATHAMFSFGAHFVEVRVEPLTNRISLGRMVGVFDCGTIVNPRTAHANLAGGMIWGASHALMEETFIDHAQARFANTDLGSYHVAVQADIGDVVVETIEIEDRVVNPLGVKSVGEIGVVGIGAAIANAVHHATGVRVRKMPILIDDLV